MSSEVFELMQSVCQLSVTSDSEHIRQQCRQVGMKYYIDHVISHVTSLHTTVHSSVHVGLPPGQKTQQILGLLRNKPQVSLLLKFLAQLPSIQVHGGYCINLCTQQL